LGQFNNGYTLIDYDLNSGADGYYVYTGYMRSKEITDSLKDLRVMIKSTDDYTSPENGVSYSVVGKEPISMAGHLGDGIVNLNIDAGGDSLYYFATRDLKAGDPIIDMTVDTTETVSGYDTVKYLNSANFNENADANRGTKKHNQTIYTHIKRLPQVDTTKLRATMESAAATIASTAFIEESKASLKSALAQAEKITTAYDDYIAGTDAYNSVYDQTKIDAAEQTIKEAMGDLIENIDDSNTPKVTFYVPETIYLDPNDNQTFQYFYGVGTDGKPVKNTSTEDAAKGAMVYFDVANCTPTSVKITVEASSNNATDWKSTASGNLSSITYGETTDTEYFSFPVNIQCTAGKMSSAVPAGGYRFLKWTAHYVVDGMTFKAYAYSLCYAPYDKPAAAAARAYTSYGRKSDIQQIAWISGITGSYNNGTYTNNTENFNPIKGIITLPENTSNTGGLSQNNGTYLTESSGTAILANYSNGETNIQAEAVAPTGKLVLDSTRFSNLKYVPNFKIGYLISLVNEGNGDVDQRRFGYYFTDVSSLSYNSASATGGKDNTAYFSNREENKYIASDTTYESTTEEIAREYCRPRLVYNNVWDKEISSSSTVIIKGAGRFGTRSNETFTNRNANAQASSVVPLEVTVVNKALLRAKVNVAVSNALQENWFANGYDVYQNSLLAMAINLENPASSVTSGTADRSKLERVSGTVTTSYIRDPKAGADYNGNIGTSLKSSTSTSFTGGEDVFVTYQYITGYTLNSYTVSDNTGVIATGTPKSDNNYFIKSAGSNNLEWKFIYSPNKYTATYDPNGGSYNGTTEASTNQGTYETAYSVGVFDGTAIDNPTRTGYIFAGWKCDATGSIYNSGDSLNWSFAKNIKFTAQWNVISYKITFKNGDTILQDTAFAYDTTPTFSGANPTKESDDHYEYTFSGWSPEITKVTGEATYEAQFTAAEHHFKSVKVDGETHRSECDCGYKLESTKHNIELKDGKYTCKDCGYVVPDFNAVTADGATLTKTLRADMTTKYLVATVSYPNAAKPNKEGKYFVYWYDRASGEIVSAFTTYSFFLTKEVDIIPVFATQKDYYTERAKATTVLRMVGCKQNEDKSYSILAERSISSSAGSINSHGMIYTTDASLVDSLDWEHRDVDGVKLLTAQRTSTVRTGLYEAKITGAESGVVYARPYIVLVNADGTTKTMYGNVVTYNLTNTQSAESDVLSTSSYDLSDISAEEPITPTEPTEKNPLEKIADLFARLVEIIKTILSFFGLTGVTK